MKTVPLDDTSFLSDWGGGLFLGKKKDHVDLGTSIEGHCIIKLVIYHPLTLANLYFS